MPDGVKNTVATHGVSVFNDPNEVTCRGFNAHKIDESSVPDTLKIQQRGQNKKHFEIMPREPMTLDAYTEALAKIVSKRLDLSFGIFARRGEKYSCYALVLKFRVIHR